MKKSVLSFLFFYLSSNLFLHSQTSSCNNVDFEAGNFTNWIGKKGYNALSTNPLTITNTGIFTAGMNASWKSCSYHTIMSAAGGTDYYGGFPVVNPTGGTYSVRLGGENTNVFDGTDCNNLYVCSSPAPQPGPFYCGGETLEQTFAVTATNTLFTFSYAALLNDGGHPAGHQPYFSIQVFNSSGTAIACFSQRVELVSGVVPTGGSLSANGNCWFNSGMTDYNVYFIPWRTNSYNLTAYVGQNLTVRLTAAGCTDGDHFCYAYFDASCGPASITVSNPAPCTGSQVTLTAPVTISNTYSWTGPGIVGANNTQSISVNASGTYTVTVGTGACAYTLSVPVTFTGSGGAVTISSVPSTVCLGQSTTLTASPATSYNWSANAGGGNTNSAVVIPPAGSTTYTVTGLNGGCNYNASITIVANPQPNASAALSGTITCSVPTANVVGSSTTAGVTYSWTGPGIVAGGNSATATVNAVGTYTVTVTNSSTGCTNTATATVTSNMTLPNLTAGAPLTLPCGTPSGTISASSTTAGVTYSWAGPGIVSGGTTSSPTVNAAGTYTVTVTVPSGGCSNTATVAVTFSGTLPNVTAGAPLALTCSVTSGTITASSTTAGVTYSWAGPGIVSGGTTSSPTVSTVGTYTVTVTAPTGGCTNTATVNVTNTGTLPNVTPGAPLNLNCSALAGTISASSTTNGATYNWSGPGVTSGGTTSTPTVNAVGTYTVTVTDPSSGCTNSATVNVTNNSTLPNVSPGAPLVLNCTTTSGTITASSTSSGVTYNWAGPNIISGGTTSNATVNTIGTYTITVTDPSTGCTNSATVAVTNTGAIPNVTAGAPLTLTCTTLNGNVSASSTTAGVTYSWAGPGITSGGNTSIASVNAIGTYTITVTDPGSGCLNTTTVNVSNNTTPPPITVGAPLLLTCVTLSGTISANSTVPNVTYSWSGAGITNGSATSTATVNAIGTYTVTITDPANGCINSSTVNVANNATLPTVTGGSPLALTCNSSSGTISASSTTPNVTYNWTGSGITGGSNTSTATVNTVGTYTVTVTNPANGCTNTATVNVTSTGSIPNVTAGPAINISCNTHNATISASSTTVGVTYHWTGPGIVSGGNTPNPIINAAGTYTVTVTNPAGCTNSATVIATATPGPTAIAGPNSIILQGSSATIIASGGGSYLWNNGATTDTLTVSPLVTTSYCVTVTDANNCTDTACARILVEIPCPTDKDLQVPNAFSPNGDGYNDEFCLHGWTYCISEFQIFIFDRWGEKVFSSTDSEFCWDGSYKGKNLDPAVFVYFITAILDNKQSVAKKGNISLIR